jgi:hypothetical protein
MRNFHVTNTTSLCVLFPSRVLSTTQEQNSLRTAPLAKYCVILLDINNVELIVLPFFMWTFFLYFKVHVNLFFNLNQLCCFFFYKVLYVVHKVAVGDATSHTERFDMIFFYYKLSESIFKPFVLWIISWRAWYKIRYVAYYKLSESRPCDEL